MNVLPVITRELRAQARQPFTYLLRLYGVSVLLAVTCYVVFQPEFTGESGPELFLWLHRTLLATIWFLIPLAAADCLSRERREGTLGLLFLTPLSARDIVIAKCAAHGLRAFTLWLASLPVQVVPFLLGGIGWGMVMASCAVNFCSILLVIGVSVLASAFCRRAQRAVALAAALGLFSVVTLSYLLSVVMMLVFLISVALLPSPPSWSPFGSEDWWGSLTQTIWSPGDCVESFLQTVLGASYAWQPTRATLPKQYQDAWIISWSVGAVLALAVAIELIRLAAIILRRRWRESMHSPRVEQLEKAFCRPIVGIGLLQRWLRRRLERNPIGWLEQRTWSGRLLVWAWLAVMTSVYSFVFTSGLGRFMYEFDGLQLTLSVLLLLSLAATAAGSFRRERETGVLELLLVSPLSERQIIAGRLRGIWMQFLPSVALLAFVWLFAGGFLGASNPWNVLWVVSSFATLPMIGLHSSLCFPGYVGSVIATLLFGQAVPALVVLLPQVWRAFALLTGLRSVPNWPEHQPTGMIFGVTAQCLIAIGLVVSLHTNLVQRRFATGSRIS